MVLSRIIDSRYECYRGKVGEAGIRTISNDGLGYDECIFENEETGKRT